MVSAYVKITYKVNGEISTKTVAVMRGGQCFGVSKIQTRIVASFGVGCISRAEHLVIDSRKSE